MMSSQDPRQFTALLRGLRQRRSFTADPIPEEILQDILEVARWTGSSSNTQPWEFIVVRDREKIRVIAESGKHSGFLAGAAVVIVIVLRGKQAMSESYDEGRVSERILLAAEAYGLGSGTGWFSTPDAWEPVKQLLGIPDELVTHQALGIGYPDPAVGDGIASMGGRRAFDDVIRFESYAGTTDV
jgi:nitroreductase